MRRRRKFRPNKARCCLFSIRRWKMLLRAKQTIAAPIQVAEAILRALSLDLLMAAFLPETTITLDEFGTQMSLAHK